MPFNAQVLFVASAQLASLIPLYPIAIKSSIETQNSVVKLAVNLAYKLVEELNNNTGE